MLLFFEDPPPPPLDWSADANAFIKPLGFMFGFRNTLLFYISLLN
jgi:hypothetical protein